MLPLHPELLLLHLELLLLHLELSESLPLELTSQLLVPNLPNQKLSLELQLLLVDKLAKLHSFHVKRLLED